VGNNILVGGEDSYNEEDQINPGIAVDEEGGFHVVWQDNRDNNYNIYITSYSPTITIPSSPYTWTQVR